MSEYSIVFQDKDQNVSLEEPMIKNGLLSWCLRSLAR